MAKVGSPGAPQIPRNAPATPGKGQAAPAQAPAPPPASPGQVNAQVVAQQFVSAFMMAGALVKGLVNPNVKPGKAEKPASSEKTSESKEGGEAQSAEGDAGLGDIGDKDEIMTALAALKKTRQFRFKKIVKKGKGGKAEFVSQLLIVDDWKEDEKDHQKGRRYLGDEKEETEFDEAKRAALFLLHLERQGELPTRIARHLNALLAVHEDREFKHMISDQVRPQMDAMASRIDEIDEGERRMLAALISRAAFQVGVRSSENYGRLLAAAGAAEAARLAQSSDGPVKRAEQLLQALRQAASPTYRTAVIEAGRGGLEWLGSDLVGLSPRELLQTWVSLFHAAECIDLLTLPTMAEALVSGAASKGGSTAMVPLAEVLTPALKAAPWGGALAVQVIVTLAGRGETKAAEQLSGVLCEVIRQARGQCVPALGALRDLRANPAAGGDEQSLLQELERQAPLLAALIPTCSRVLEKGQGIPAEASAVLGESLLCMATLNIVGATSAGQQLLRKTLLGQERNMENFLVTLPRVALTLAQPKLVRPLWDSGLTPAHFQFGGRPFLERVALYTGRAVAGAVLARNQKGDFSAAKVLLRSAIRSNPALFGLTPDGAYLAAEALEALRERPNKVILKGTMVRLAKVRKKYTLGTHPGSIDPFLDLVNALAETRISPKQRQAVAEIIP